MICSVTQEGFARSWTLIRETGQAEGRAMDGFGNIVTAVLNIQDDADEALTDAKSYLDLYYGTDYTPERLHAWGPSARPPHVPPGSGASAGRAARALPSAWRPRATR